MRRRLRKVLLRGAALLLGGCTYAAICTFLGWGIPCLFYSATGLLCPGCGVSRMCLCLLRLDFAGAWEANPVILCMLPLGAAMGVDCALRYVKTGNGNPRGWCSLAMWVMIGVLLVYGILRNI